MSETVTTNLVYCNWGNGPLYNGYYYHLVFDVHGGQVNPTRSYEKDNYQYKVDMHTGVRK